MKTIDRLIFTQLRFVLKEVLGMKAGSDLDFVIDSLPWEFMYAMTDNVPANSDNFVFITHSTKDNLNIFNYLCT